MVAPTAPPDNVQKVLTVSEAAKYLGVHRATANRWVRDGKIPGVFISSRWFIPRWRLEELLNERTAHPAPDVPDTPEPVSVPAPVQVLPYTPVVTRASRNRN